MRGRTRRRYRAELNMTESISKAPVAFAMSGLDEWTWTAPSAIEVKRIKKKLMVSISKNMHKSNVKK